MAMGAPKGRKYLSADALFGWVRRGLAPIPAHRWGETDVSFPEALMAALAMFSLQAPSLLACAKERPEGNVATISGMEPVPCATRMREILDPVSPEAFRPVCTSVMRQRQRDKALEARAFLDDHSLVSLDGPGYFSSKARQGASWLPRVPRDGSVTYAHQRGGAALVHPDQRAVVPVRPAPMVQHDGVTKNDGARPAAQRLRAKVRQDSPPLPCIVTAASLRAHAPPIEPLHDDDWPSIFGGTEGEQALLLSQGQAAERAGRVTGDARQARAAGIWQRGRCGHDVPLHAATMDVRGNCIEAWERGKGKVQPCRWVTARRVSRRHGFPLMRGGRARGKMAQETFTTLKNQGEHCEHHEGHGQHPLSVVLAMVMRRAF